MRLYDTATRQVEEIRPDGSALRMYCCGPTVYRDAHVGNLRTFLLGDLIRRTAEFEGQQVRLIQNITDNSFRARVISVYFALLIGAQAIGVLVIGWIAEHAGFRIAFGGGAVLSLLVVAIAGPGLWRQAGALEAPRTGS